MKLLYRNNDRSIPVDKLAYYSIYHVEDFVVDGKVYIALQTGEDDCAICLGRHIGVSDYYPLDRLPKRVKVIGGPYIYWNKVIANRI